MRQGGADANDHFRVVDRCVLKTNLEVSQLQGQASAGSKEEHPPPRQQRELQAQQMGEAEAAAADSDEEAEAAAAVSASTPGVAADVPSPKVLEVADAASDATPA